MLIPRIQVEDLSLVEWLALISNPPEDVHVASYRFPTNAHREEFLADVHRYSEREIISILQSFLIPSCSLGCDKNALNSYYTAEKSDPSGSEHMLSTQYYKRLVYWDVMGPKSEPPWQGITWIIDLLPRHPKEALAALEAYVLAHCQQLPDGRFDGLIDAADLIHARFIGSPGLTSEKLEFLQDLEPRQLECITERVYRRMGYSTILTGRGADGGRDVIAMRENIGQRERVLIECKRYRKAVDIKIARALLGIVTSEKVNKGVLVTSGTFTSAVRALANENTRLDLVDGTGLIALLNEHIGPNWPSRIESLVLSSLREASPSTVQS